MKKLFLPVPMGGSRVLEAKKATFSSRHGLCKIIFLSLGELDTYLQNLIPTRDVEHCGKKYFLQQGMLKFSNKSLFLTMEKTFLKLLY
jgi:hypothetical protein